MKHLHKFIFVVMMYIIYSTHVIAAPGHLTGVQSIIDKGESPDGIVFEIVSRDIQYLDWTLPEAEKLSRLLHEKYPALDIVIVTHGSEQFSLTKKSLSNNKPLSDTVHTLISNDITIHVCGTYAERKGIEAEEFSQLVNVAAEGPAQINDYIKLGYLRFKILKN